MRTSNFISSPQTWVMKYFFPLVCIGVGIVATWLGQTGLGMAATLAGSVTGVTFFRMRRVQLSMDRIRIRRLTGDVWIDFHNVVAVEPRFPLGVESAVLELDKNSVIGRRIWFVLDRRYLFGRDWLVRPTHPTIKAMRTLCEDARAATKSDQP
ncbi:MAG: hypothetical protein AB8G99_08480 [Planctomycetaceae bacterium]